MKIIAACLILSSLTLSVKAADPAFDCIIASDRTSYAIGEFPVISVRIINKTSKDAVLIPALDGSMEGMRFPVCRVEIFDAAGKQVKTQVPRCGNLNHLKATDFSTIPAAGTFLPYGREYAHWGLETFHVTQPGEYTFRFVYSTSNRIEGFLGDERMEPNVPIAPEIERLFQKVPKLELKSNELKLKFTGKPK